MIQLHDQNSYGDDHEQQRPKRQAQISRGSTKNAAIRAQNNWQLVLKQPHCQKMSLEFVLGRTDCFLVGGVTEHHHHHQSRNNGHEYNTQKREIDSKKLCHDIGRTWLDRIMRRRYSMYPSPCSLFFTSSLVAASPSSGGSTFWISFSSTRTTNSSTDS